MNNKLIYVGIYPLACINTELYAEVGARRGEGSFRTGTNSHPRLTVGIGGDWEDTVDLLLHEALEQCLSAYNHRWMPDSGGNASDECLFVFNHPQFDMICTQTAWFLVRAIPDLAAVWRTHSSPTKGRKK